MANQRIQDIVRKLKRGSTRLLAVGLALIGFGFATLLLSPIPSLRIIGVLSILIGTLSLCMRRLGLTVARDLAGRKVIPEPTRFSSWFAKERNVTIIFLLGILLGFVILFLIGRIVA